MIPRRIHNRYLLTAAFLCCLGFTATARPYNWSETAATILQQPDDKIDLLKLKLSVDMVVDPSADPEATQKKIETIVSRIEGMLPLGATSMQKLQAIRTYLYGMGSWNNYQPYQYDFEDPKGKNLRSKTLARYLATKKGNCVSMPMLFIVIADRMGLDISASTAPEHVLVKFTETETGRTYNVEATSGAGFSREKWYQEQMHITDQAIGSGAYLQKLSRKETAAVMVSLLGEYHYDRGEFEKSIEILELSLKYYPKMVYSMLKIGGSYSKMFEQRFMKKYKDESDVPMSERKLLRFYVDQNRRYFAMAEALGWQESSRI